MEAHALRLQFFAGFEANGLPFRDGDLSAGARIAPDTAFARFDDEDAEAAKLYALAALHCFFHRLKEGFDRSLSFHLRDAGLIRDIVDDVQFDHSSLPLGFRKRLVV